MSAVASQGLLGIGATGEATFGRRNFMELLSVFLSPPLFTVTHGREQVGFVDETTPELAIAVVPSRRGRGIGETLLEALVERARAEGHRALSLSVESSLTMMNGDLREVAVSICWTKAIRNTL